MIQSAANFEPFWDYAENTEKPSSEQPNQALYSISVIILKHLKASEENNVVEVSTANVTIGMVPNMAWQNFAWVKPKVSSSYLSTRAL